MATHTAVIGFEDPTDTEQPTTEITSPTADSELSYVHTIEGPVTDPNLLGFTVSAKRVGGTVTRVLSIGVLPITSGTLATFDTTQLENGYWELTITARDVNAADLGVREYLTYSLDEAPPDMEIDPVTGVIQWIAGPALGSEPITVRVTDSTALSHTQSFLLGIVPDATPPVLTLTATPERVAPGKDVVIAFTALDDVEVQFPYCAKP